MNFKEFLYSPTLVLGSINLLILIGAIIYFIIAEPFALIFMTPACLVWSFMIVRPMIQTLKVDCNGRN